MLEKAKRSGEGRAMGREVKTVIVKQGLKEKLSGFT